MTKPRSELKRLMRQGVTQNEATFVDRTYAVWRAPTATTETRAHALVRLECRHERRNETAVGDR